MGNGKALKLACIFGVGRSENTSPMSQAEDCMRHLALIFTIFWTAATNSLPATAEELQPLKCDIGPVTKTYGKTQWLVYSCSDGRTVVIVSAPGNPALPFYFTLYPQGNGYQLGGEGTGRKDATGAAFDELKALSEQDIAALIEQTKTH